MRRNNVKVGMLVALNERPDAQVYRVESIDNFTVTLAYTVSGRVARGQGDCSVLRLPTPIQLAASGI
jgi:hypothetical protein